MSLASDLIQAAPGKVFDYAGLRLPAGYLWCAGQAISRTTYARLFAALSLTVTGNTSSGSPTISSVNTDLTAATLGFNVAGWPISGPGISPGTTISSVTSNSITLSANATAPGTAVAIVIAPHGIGDGSTTFNVPDCRGRVGAGRDDMGGTAANRLTNAGSGVTGTRLGHAGGAETHTLTAAQIPAHNHPIASGGPATGAGAATNFWQGPGPSSGMNTMNSTGGDGAHQNTQPTFVMNKIIKT